MSKSTANAMAMNRQTPKAAAGKSKSIPSRRRSSPSQSTQITSSPNNSGFSNNKLATVNESSQEQMNQHFLRELTQLYIVVDKASDLIWAARGESELIANVNRRTRSKFDKRDKEVDQGWMKDFHGSIGYGEITKVSCENPI